MEIDSYQQCPCQSGKKIKFCCGKDLVSDLNTVLSKEQAGQSIAALEHLDRAIKKAGPRECLLTIQTHILIAHGEIEKAKQSNSLLLQHHPNHITGMQHQALIELADGNLLAAVEALQDTMDAIPGNELPISLANAFRAVGVGLLNDGDLIAGRAHLQFASNLKGGEDRDLGMTLLNTFRHPSLSILMKRDFVLAQPPAEETEWHKKYINVHRALDRGQFRKALKFLRKIDEAFPNQPMVVEGIAIVSAYLGRRDDLPNQFRRVSELDELSHWQKIEAESLAQALDPEPQVPGVDLLRITFEIDDASAASEAATSSDRFLAQPPVEADPFGEGPAPKHIFSVLDRPMVADLADLTIDNVSNPIGEISLFGKQTDRAARLELITADDEVLSTTLDLVQQTFGDCSPKETNRATVGTRSDLDRALRVDWHLPRGATRADYDALVQKHVPTMFDNWCQLPFRCLGGRTVRDCASDESLQIKVHSLLAQLEQGFQSIPGGPASLQSCLKELGVEMPAKIDASTVEGVETLSPFCQQRIDLATLTDEQLMMVHQMSITLGNAPTIEPTVDEMLRRDNNELMPRELLYSMKAQVTQDDDTAFEFLTKAKDAAQAEGKPIGIYLVYEFEMRLQRGMTEKLPAMLQTIRSKHLQEPDVEAELAQTLHRFGLLDEQQLFAAPGSPAPEMAAAAEPAAAAKEPSKLWLPD